MDALSRLRGLIEGEAAALRTLGERSPEQVGCVLRRLALGCAALMMLFLAALVQLVLLDQTLPGWIGWSVPVLAAFIVYFLVVAALMPRLMRRYPPKGRRQ